MQTSVLTGPRDHTIPSFPLFAPLSLQHEALLNQYTASFPYSSEYTFPTLWCWNIDSKVALSILYGNLVIQSTDHATGKYCLSFLGNYSINATMDVLLQVAEERDDYLPYLIHVPTQAVDGVASNEKYILIEDPCSDEYICSVDDLATFRGAKYRAQRNLINRFQKGNCWKIQFLDMNSPQNLHDVENLNQIWIQKQLHKGNDVALYINALRKVAEIQDAKIRTLGLYTDGCLIGYNIYALSHHGMAIGLFEVANTDYRGVYAFLKNQVARDLLSNGYRYLNMQEDLGITGLRLSKERYHPIFSLRKYAVCRRKVDVMPKNLFRSVSRLKDLIRINNPQHAFGSQLDQR